MYPASRVAVPRVAASLHAAARHSRPVPRVRKSTNKFPKSGLDLRWFIWLVQKSPAMRYVGLQYAPSAGRHDQSHRRPAALKASERSRPLFAANVCPKSGFLEIKTNPNGTLTSHIVIDPRPSETDRTGNGNLGGLYYAVQFACGPLLLRPPVELSNGDFFWLSAPRCR
jgi:hypothetical protein